MTSEKQAQASYRATIIFPQEANRGREREQEKAVFQFPIESRTGSHGGEPATRTPQPPKHIPGEPILAEREYAPPSTLFIEPQLGRTPRDHESSKGCPRGPSPACHSATFMTLLLLAGWGRLANYLLYPATLLVLA